MSRPFAGLRVQRTNAPQRCDAQHSTHVSRQETEFNVVKNLYNSATNNTGAGSVMACPVTDPCLCKNLPGQQRPPEVKINQQSLNYADFQVVTILAHYSFGPHQFSSFIGMLPKSATGRGR
jgi:hypothetical protein